MVLSSFKGHIDLTLEVAYMAQRLLWASSHFSVKHCLKVLFNSRLKGQMLKKTLGETIIKPSWIMTRDWSPDISGVLSYTFSTSPEKLQVF